MADLFTGGLAALGIGASIAGTSEQVQSQQLTGQANAQMYGYQAAIARQNAKIANQNAAWTRNVGEDQAAASGMQGRAQVGQIRAGLGASNLSLNSGSAADVVASAHEVGAIDQTTIRSNAAQQAYGYEVQAAQDKSQSAIDTQAQGYALQGAAIGETASVIGGAASVASKWLSASQSGAFSGVSNYSLPNPTYGGGTWGIGS